MSFKNQLSLNVIEERHLDLACRKVSSDCLVTLYLKTTNISEYSSKIQLFDRLFINLNPYSMVSSNLILRKKILSIKKSTGKTKVRSFGLAAAVVYILSRKAYPLNMPSLSNFIMILDYFVDNHTHGIVLKKSKILNSKQVLLSFNFLNRLIKFKSIKTISSSTIKKHNFDKNDTLHIVFNFSSIQDSLHFLELYRLLVKS